MDLATSVKTQNKIVLILRIIDTIGKDMNPITLPSVMCKTDWII